MKNVLVIAAHPDDEVLGAGGVIARHHSQGDKVHVLIVTEGSSAQYPGQPEMVAKKAEQARRAAAILGVSGEDVLFGNLPDMALDGIPSTALTRCIESAVQSTQPAIVYTHAQADINLDHRLVHNATLVACRPYVAPFVEFIYAYFAPSSSEWGLRSFDPNHFVDISPFMDRKLEAMQAYPSELRAAPHPRSLESLRATFACFGSTVGCAYAEAFRLIRSVSRV